MTTRVAVIGAGPSGLAVLRAFVSARNKGAEIREIVCFEKQDTWGGLWNYNWRTGTQVLVGALDGSQKQLLATTAPLSVFDPERLRAQGRYH